MNNTLEQLEKEIIEQPFVLFLGAGVSYPMAPLWNDLLGSLFKKAITKVELNINIASVKKLDGHLNKFDPCFKSTVIKKMLGKEYLITLQREIYSHELSSKDKLLDEYESWKLNKEYNINNPCLLFLIADLIIKRKIRAVVTYNYDNYLTMILDNLPNKKIIDVYKKQTPGTIKGNEFLIYHVHGYIPPPNMIIKEKPENLVLAYDEYFSNMMEPYSWQTTTQLHFLMNYKCLFLGTSLSDWNMLRILAHSNKYIGGQNHYIITEKSNYGTEDIKRILNRIKATVFDEVGIKTIFSDNYMETYNSLKKLI